MWSPSCILEQSRFQPAIVCKTRVLLIASATVRFIGVAILWGRTAFADTHASSTASRNSLHRSHGLAKALRSGIRLAESFWTGLSCSQQNFPAIDCRPTADIRKFDKPSED